MNQLEQWAKFWQTHSKSFPDRPVPATVSDLFNFFKESDQQKCFYPDIYIIAKIMITWPTSTCSCERSFSRMKRILTEKRTLLRDEKLESLMIIATYNSIASEIITKKDILDQLILEFANMSDRRLQLK